MAVEIVGGNGRNGDFTPKPFVGIRTDYRKHPSVIRNGARHQRQRGMAIESNSRHWLHGHRVLLTRVQLFKFFGLAIVAPLCLESRRDILVRGHPRLYLSRGTNRHLCSSLSTTRRDPNLPLLSPPTQLIEITGIGTGIN